MMGAPITVMVKFAAASLAAVLWMVWILRRSSMVEARGALAGYDEQRDSENNPVQVRVIEFKDAVGMVHRFESNINFGWRDAGVGETVPVLYDPAKPDRACVNTFAHYYLTPMVITLAALAYILLG